MSVRDKGFQCRLELIDVYLMLSDQLYQNCGLLIRRLKQKHLISRREFSRIEDLCDLWLDMDSDLRDMFEGKFP